MRAGQSWTAAGARTGKREQTMSKAPREGRDGRRDGGHCPPQAAARGTGAGGRASGEGRPLTQHRPRPAATARHTAPAKHAQDTRVAPCSERGSSNTPGGPQGPNAGPAASATEAGTSAFLADCRHAVSSHTAYCHRRKSTSFTFQKSRGAFRSGTETNTRTSHITHDTLTRTNTNTKGSKPEIGDGRRLSSPILDGRALSPPREHAESCPPPACPATLQTRLGDRPGGCWPTWHCPGVWELQARMEASRRRRGAAGGGADRLESRGTVRTATHPPGDRREEQQL